MLKLQNISISADKKSIVKDVNFHIKAGELHLLLGKNGSGKSSLAMALAGHPNYTITAGNFWIQGNLATKMLPENKAKEGLFLSFQNPPEIEGLSVIQFIKTATNSLLKKQNKKPLSAPDFFKKLQNFQVELEIEQSLLSRSLNRNFSGGEKKKIEMLQMLFLKPKIAILDEPDSGVDINTKRIISKTIQRMKKDEKTAFLIITHTFDFAKTLSADTVHVMQNGKIIKSGEIDLLEKIERTGF
ncbi:MAG: Fe-S cluster assembly ATPase SufC [Alphaproteobacteria bacterium]|nr:MAG: Fe-S cluster assembly ATPase SufC [Rickettsiaceae bacterium 4572_127]